MQMTGVLDVLIPRGGKGLIQSVVENARVPVIQTGAGIAIYMSTRAPTSLWRPKSYTNAKVSRPSVCNAVETVLVHEAVAERALPVLKKKLDEHGVEWRGCERTRAILGEDVRPAAEEDWEDRIRRLYHRVQESSKASTRRFPILPVTAPATASASSHRIIRARSSFCSVSTAPPCTSMPPRALRTAACSASAPKSASARKKLHARGSHGRVQQLTSSKFLILGSGQVR